MRKATYKQSELVRAVHDKFCCPLCMHKVRTLVPVARSPKCDWCDVFMVCYHGKLP